MHDESRTGRPKLLTDECVNMIHMLLNENRRLTLQELEMIMNNNLGNPLSRMSISHIVTILGTQFYQSSIQKLVSRNDNV